MNVMGTRIKELRLQKGLTQDELAEILGVNRANISNYERGQVTNIPSDKLDIMADLFKTNVDYIMGRTDVKESPTLGQKAPEWATAKDKRDLEKYLEDMGPLFYKGVEFSEEDKAKMIGVAESIFWDAKRKNKEAYKKSRQKNKDNQE
ncbi:helix-turn-helix transcriptional regulator [Paenibacillus macerans]|uniref:helix-turn-helix domain-containing protein n=1 Tax=Paenibacillus macerans TaxID=44252 RepID=UPI002DB9312E|nr:helix-turn-helix transcriptional regulator [Paenibacillus macerans]MEC0140436.1 helix-turn-helix transcriptional regulator [Paenibacillus macerans]